MLLSGDATDVLKFEGEPVHDDTFLLLINAHYESIAFVLPGQEHLEWKLILNTSDVEGFVAEPKRFASGDDVDLDGRTCCLLQLVGGTQAQAREESWKKRHVEFPRFSAEEERARHSGRAISSSHAEDTRSSKRDVATASDFIYRNS
jgi:glycogen operon protein